MIHNIIFDMGNVLLRFNGAAILARYLPDPADQALVQKELFESGDWVRLDWGELREPELAALVGARLPERLRAPLSEMLAHWHEELPQIDQSYALVKELKQNGYRLYLLSNAGHAALEEQYTDRVPAFRYLDGRIVSARIGSIKPHAEIYQALFDTFALKPEECFFIDDLSENIEGGRRFGMDGHIFDGDDHALRLALQAAGVEIETQTAFRPATTEKDLAAVSDLAVEIWNQHFVPMIGQEQVDYMIAKFQSEQALKQQLQSGYQYYFLCWNGDPVGYTGFRIDEDGLFLSKLYLLERFRGRKIARKTLEFLTAVAEEYDKSRIWLTVNRNNTDTVAAYQTMGFAITEEKVADIGGGFVMDDYIMTLPVPPFQG